MGVLIENGLETVRHYAPLHYLPFIAGSSALLGKPTLAAMGYLPTHLRSMSSKQDIERGFGQYAFLTIDQSPRILKSKLSAGFPHIAVDVPSKYVEESPFGLCRFNVAMTRFLRRGNRPGFPESPKNGRYYPGHEIPIARTEPEKASLLPQNIAAGNMVEVLIEGDLTLPEDTRIICYSPEDAEIVHSVLSAIGKGWSIQQEDAPGPYNRRPGYVASVQSFVERALANPDWKGDGLEFDRLTP